MITDPNSPDRWATPTEAAVAAQLFALPLAGPIQRIGRLAVRRVAMGPDDRWNLWDRHQCTACQPSHAWQDAAAAVALVLADQSDRRQTSAAS